LPDLEYEVEQADDTALKLPPHPGEGSKASIAACRPTASAMRSGSQARLSQRPDSYHATVTSAIQASSLLFSANQSAIDELRWFYARA
jgi:hypothetical protein